ncbi:MAG: hypothetical protein WBD51_14920, partial [Burkholderiaceae bacterium]
MKFFAVDDAIRLLVVGLLAEADLVVLVFGRAVALDGATRDDSEPDSAAAPVDPASIEAVDASVCRSFSAGLEF